jgi:hypothetical protein
VTSLFGTPDADGNRHGRPGCRNRGGSRHGRRLTGHPRR